MPKSLTVTVSVKDTEIFNGMVDILEKFLEDPTIQQETKNKYREHIESLLIEGDTKCTPGT